MSNTTIIIVSNILTAIIFFFAGYFIGQKTKKGEVFKYAVGLGVLAVWIYRLVISSQNANIIISVWEHIMTGLVVYSLWGAKDESKNNFIDLLLYKVTGQPNEPKKEIKK